MSATVRPIEAFAAWCDECSWQGRTYMLESVAETEAGEHDTVHHQPATARRARKGKRVIVWDSFTGNGHAPDGSTYGLESEHTRGEGTWYWATFDGRELAHPTDPWAHTQAKAKQAAEHHYRTTHPKPTDSTKEAP